MKNGSRRRGQSMGYWLNEPSILQPERFDSAILELSNAGYAFLRVILRNTNFTHRSPEVVAAIARATDVAHRCGMRIALDCEPHSKPLAADLGRQFPDALSTRLVRATATIVNGRFRVVVPGPRVEAYMVVWSGIECAFVQVDGKVTQIEAPTVNLDWEIETYRDGDTRLRQDYTEGRAVSERRICRLTGNVPSHVSGQLILYVRFVDIGMVDFWAPGLREYFDDLLNRYKGIPLDGVGWDEPAIGGDWNNYRYGNWFAKAFQQRNGYSLSDRAYLLDASDTTSDSLKVRLDYYETLNEGVTQAQAAMIKRSRELFGDDLLLGTHHTWQGEGGINDYRAGAVDYFRLADTQDAGYTDCWWWDEASVCYAYVLATSLGRLSPTGEAEVNSWHAKPTNLQVEYNARLMSMFNLTWFNIWFGDNADTCQYPQHYTWNTTKMAMRAHDAVQEALFGLEPAVEIAIWHGWEGILATNNSRIANAHKTCTMNLATSFTKRNVPFDFVDSRVIAEAKVDGETLRTKLGQYRVLVIPYAVAIPEGAWNVCVSFAKGGGRVVFVGPPPTFTTDGRDISQEFAEVAGLKQPITVSEYSLALDAQFTLPNHRATFLDCAISLDGYSDNVTESVEGERHATTNASGRVVYLTDLDPRERLLDVVSPWLIPKVECYSDSVLWRLYVGTDRHVLVVIAKEGRTIDAVVQLAGQTLQLRGGTVALLTVDGETVTASGVGVSCTPLAR